IKFGEGFKAKIADNTVLSTLNRKYQTGRVINCAGLYADKIAKQFGFSEYYNIIPFKGIYLKYHGESPPVKINVYPVPNLKNPFLGVHFTITVDGQVKIGPSSIPAFWRENYNGLTNIKIEEMANVLFWETKLFIKNSFNFRDLAFDEIKKYYKPHFISMGQALVKKLDQKGFNDWGKPGIRAQLLDVRNNKLVMDFIIEGDKNSTHVLNAVSPAFTCAFPFARYICENYILN
ncbi:MAG: FAD-dependent oxidoreductase, partial [Bacteroidia bacterium]|nr:FAD-dependent oxidoreductase [Bacteroidia bacterium]